MANRFSTLPKTFRKTFTFAAKEITHYFPGHMAKGMVQMQRRLKDVDCIVEIHDARIPFSGRNPHFDEAVCIRPRLLLLNKYDLADLTYSKDIEAQFMSQGVQKVMYTNCKDQFHYVIKRKILPTILELINSSSRYHRADVEDYNVLVIGIPNVGKSSFINALRRTHLKKKKATKVGAISGVTKSVLEKIKVSDSPPVYLYDTPGILHPNITDLEVGMKLALCASLKDHLVGEDLIADYMLYWMNKHEQFRYVRHFGLKEPTDDIYELLRHVAIQRKLIIKQRSPTGIYMYRPHFIRAAQIVLRAFREGELGYINLDVDLIQKQKDITKTNLAVT